MNKKLLRRIFPFIAIILLAPWPVIYGHEASGAVAGQETIEIEVAEASARPTWTAFGKAIGGVDTPGDLFYIDVTDSPANIQVALHITNAQELIHCYRYMILEVGVYAQGNSGEWEKASYGGEPIPGTFITLRNGHVSFTLPGYTNYKLAIDSGSFNCITTNVDDSSLSPQFYLSVN